MRDEPDPIEQLRYTMATLIMWIVSSSVSPISLTEAKKLLAMLPPERK